MSTLKTTLNDLEIEIHFEYFKASPGLREAKTGVPLTPDDPEDMVIESVIDLNTDTNILSTLTPDQVAILYEKLWEKLYSDKADEWDRFNSDTPLFP